MSATDFFNTYEVKVDSATLAVPAFFIESNAPDNFNDKSSEPTTPDHCIAIPTQEAAIDRIAEKLLEQAEPKLVITVHGFNSPRDAVLEHLYKILSRGQRG